MAPPSLCQGVEADMTQILDHRGNLIIASHEDTNHSSTHDRIVVASEMECDQLIRENRQLRDAQTGKEQFRLVARYPAPIVEKAMLEGWLHDDDKWSKLINDPQYRDFRVAEGTY